MTSIQPKTKDDTNISASLATVNPSMEGDASNLRQSRERDNKESAAD